MNNKKTMVCPTCGNTLIIDEGYITWCEKCKWNIDPESYYQKKPNLIDKFYRKISKKSVDNLFYEVCNLQNIKHNISPYTIFAYILSTLINLVTLMCLFFGLKFLFLPSMLFHQVTGLLLIVLSTPFIPRYSKIKATFLERNEFPMIYWLVDKISDELGCKKVDYICADYTFNAFFTTRGLKRYVIMGTPYFSVLTLNEKASVIAHEIAHGLNQDTSRHKYIRFTLSSLESWYYSLQYMFITKPLAPLVVPFIYLLGMMLWRDRQKAEYFADYHSARISGIEAVMSSSEKFNYHPTFYKALKRVAELSSITDLFGFFRKRIENVPEREKLRVRTIESIETSKLHSSHPPTPLRNEFIALKVKSVPLLKLEPEEIQKLEKEFLEIEKQIQKKLLSDYREYNIYRYYERIK